MKITPMLLGTTAALWSFLWVVTAFFEIFLSVMATDSPRIPVWIANGVAGFAFVIPVAAIVSLLTCLWKLYRSATGKRPATRRDFFWATLPLNSALLVQITLFLLILCFR